MAFAGITSVINDMRTESNDWNKHGDKMICCGMSGFPDFEGVQTDL